MSITANAGPYISFGTAPSQDANPEAGPSLFFAGGGILDPRGPFTYEPGQNFGNIVAGFFGMTEIVTLNITPAALSGAAVAALANVASGTAMTLVAANAAGIVVGQTVTNYNTGQSVTGLLAVGQAAGLIAFGQAGTVQIWDATTMTARALSVTGVTSGAGGAFLIKGYDIYGVPMSETITCGAGVNTVNGKKAWKYIASVTPQFTDAHNYSVGTTDIFGFPLASYYFGDIYINYPSAGVTSNTGYVAADSTNPATTTTGDVRGTYALQSASDGTKRPFVTQTPLVPNIGSITGMFGITQT